MLNDVITKTNVKLGNTDTGSAWCMKALNPSSPIAISGIPDSASVPRVVKHFERTVTVSFPTAAANWNLDALLHPNPWVPAAYLSADGTNSYFTPVYNLQLGTTEPAVREFLYENTEAYRVCYGSMTAIMDATSLTNSGMVAASQYALTPIDACPSMTSGSMALGITRGFQVWPDAPKDYDQLIQMPGTYVGEAKDGAYLPMRIDPEIKWTNTNDMKLHMNTGDAVTLHWNGYDYASTAIATTRQSDWPFALPSTSATTPFKVLAFPNSQRTVAHLAMRNINPATTIRITYRLGFEFLCTPGTNYSPDLHIPPLYDPLALEAYKAVAVQLKLAYPAAYNDWQKIVRTISDIASTVLPFLPGGGFLSAAVPAIEKGVIGIGEKIASRVRAKQADRKKKQAVKGVPAIYNKPRVNGQGLLTQKQKAPLMIQPKTTNQILPGMSNKQLNKVLSKSGLSIVRRTV